MPLPKRATPQTQPLVSEEEVHNPLVSDDGDHPHGTYTPPSLPGSPVITDLSDLNGNYTLTKGDAEQIMIIEPQSGAPMSLFNYMLHVIDQERLHRVTDTTYGHNKTVKQQFISIYKQMQDAGPETNIKELLRQGLNTCELRKEDNNPDRLSRQQFWESVRFSLNEKINFQPTQSIIRPNYDAEESARQQKNNSRLVKIGWEKPVQIDLEMDECNASSPGIMSDGHARVEADIKSLIQRKDQMAIKADLKQFVGANRASTPSTIEDDEMSDDSQSGYRQ